MDFKELVSRTSGALSLEDAPVFGPLLAADELDVSKAGSGSFRSLHLYLFANTMLLMSSEKRSIFRRKPNFSVLGRVHLRHITAVHAHDVPDDSLTPFPALTLEMTTSDMPCEVIKFQNYSQRSQWRTILSSKISARGAPDSIPKSPTVAAIPKSPTDDIDIRIGDPHSLTYLPPGDLELSRSNSTISRPPSTFQYTDDNIHEKIPRGKEIHIGGLDAYLTAPGRDRPERRSSIPSSLYQQSVIMTERDRFSTSHDTPFFEGTSYEASLRSSDSEGRKKHVHVVLIVADLLGWKSSNLRCIADQIAENGFIVLVPDFFEGDTLQANTLQYMSSISTFQEKHSMERVDELAHIVIKDIRRAFNNRGTDEVRLGAIGYGWGAGVTCRLNISGACSATVITTPSNLIPLSTSAFTQPALFILLHDSAHVKRARDIRRSKKFHCAVLEFGSPDDDEDSKLSHGFVVLTPQNSNARLASRQAIEATIEFFIDSLKQN